MLKFIAKTIVVIVVFVAGIYIGQSQLLSPMSREQVDREKTQIKVNLKIDFGNNDKKSFYDVPLNQPATALSLLQKATAVNNWPLSHKDYGGDLGSMVEAINDVKNDPGTGLYWQYWVNGQYAKIGASNYHLMDQDLVEWKYTTGQL